jgi:hypothetical protein
LFLQSLTTHTVEAVYFFRITYGFFPHKMESLYRCNLVVRSSFCKIIVYRRLRGAYSRHHMGQYAPLKRRSTIIFHGSTSQKTILIIILAAVRTLNIKSSFV